ncbi:hypothetical protein RB594_000855 [Gaeumannomyces avenae]
MAGGKQYRRDDGRDDAGGYRGARGEPDGHRDRRDRGSDHPRRRDDDYDRNRDRDRRYRTRSRSPGDGRGGSYRDRRRDAGREPPRGTRDADRPPRDRGDKDRDRDRDSQRRGGREDRDHGHRRDRPREDGRRRSNSPRRSASPGLATKDSRDNDIKESSLPTRSKNSATEKSTPMSFKVGANDNGDEGRSRSASRQQRHASETGDDTPMGGSGDAEDDDLEVDDDGLAAMQAMMGFGGFGTTKNKKIVGNDVGGIRKEKKTEYRQYMNRQGGFNRPLSPSR